MIQKYQNQLDKIDKELFTMNEGEYSCYIDLTNMTFAKSSFTNDRLIFNPTDSESFIKGFNNF